MSNRKPAWQGIVKLQRPIVTSSSMNECLVYNQNRTLFMHRLFSGAELAKAFPRDAFKTYWRVIWRAATNELELVEQLGDQPW